MQAQGNSNKAIAKAQEATEVRFASVNEFRRTLSDQAAQFSKKFEVEFRVQGLNTQVLDIKSRLDKGEGKTSVSDPVIAENMRVLKEMVTSLGTSRDGGGAAAAARTAQTGFIIAALVATVSVGGFGLILFTRVSGPPAADHYQTRDIQQNSELIRRLEQELNSLRKEQGARRVRATTHVKAPVRPATSGGPWPPDSRHEQAWERSLSDAQQQVSNLGILRHDLLNNAVDHNDGATLEVGLDPQGTAYRGVVLVCLNSRGSNASIQASPRSAQDGCARTRSLTP